MACIGVPSFATDRDARSERRSQLHDCSDGLDGIQAKRAADQHRQLLAGLSHG